MKNWVNDYGDIPWWYWTPANIIWLYERRRTAPERARKKVQSRALVSALLGFCG